MGHRCSVCEESHCVMHCKWKACLHVPQTTGLSSPGYLASGEHPSKGFLQMPHTSSPAFHDQDASVRQCFTVTLNFGFWSCSCLWTSIGKRKTKDKRLVPWVPPRQKTKKTSVPSVFLSRAILFFVFFFFFFFEESPCVCHISLAKKLATCKKSGKCNVLNRTRGPCIFPMLWSSSWLFFDHNVLYLVLKRLSKVKVRNLQGDTSENLSGFHFVSSKQGSETENK